MVNTLYEQINKQNIEDKKKRLLNKQVRAVKDLQYPTFLIEKDMIGVIVDINDFGNPLVNWGSCQYGVSLSARDAELIS